MGNLRELMTCVDILGMDKDGPQLDLKDILKDIQLPFDGIWQDKIHVSGPAEADPWPANFEIHSLITSKPSKCFYSNMLGLLNCWV